MHPLCPSAIIILALMVSTGFVIPWLPWTSYIDPNTYYLKSLITNEFEGRTFERFIFIPRGIDYVGIDSVNQICYTVGAVTGSIFVSGTDYIRLTFSYEKVNW